MQKKQQFNDKTVLVIASQMDQFFCRPQSLNVQCLYQLVASTSSQFTADRDDLLTVCLRGWCDGEILGKS